MNKKFYKATALDQLQAVYMDSHIPIIYCYMTFNTRIDVDCLKHAISRTAQNIPQILCRYDDVTNAWYPAGDDINSVVKILSENSLYEDLVWDLRTGPQLKINIYHQKDNDTMQIGISHILTDGAGFQQYLALLCKFYNEQHIQFKSETNKRSIMPLLYHTAVQRFRPSHKYIHKGNIPVLFPTDADSQLRQSLKLTLSTEQLAMIKTKAKELHVTLNDIFISAYAYALKSLTLQNEFVIPCPADLRKYSKRNKQLTVANMTGKYQCCVPITGNGFLETVLEVHKQMQQLKSHYTCFHLITLLQIIHTILPSKILLPTIKQLYSIEPTSYTNMGTIDEHKVYFQGMSIKECYLCGTYRQAPSFQLSISTYRNICTLAINILGSENQRRAGMQLLREMKNTLIQKTSSPQ